MRYMFINVVAGVGSTGRIVTEQCRDLQAQGHECLIAYSREARHCEGIQTYRIGNSLDLRLHGVLSRVFDNVGFWSKRATRKLVQQIRMFDPDVIWLHNLHGYYLNLEVLFSYLRTCGKEIRWTLHDCWAFTGHCAYFDFVGCDRWKNRCFECPQKRSYPASFGRDNSFRNYEHKKQLFSEIPNLSLIVPSHWLKRRVEESFLKDYPVQVVANTVDQSVFHPTDGNFRGKYGLQNKKIVLGVANVWEPRKGLQTFCDLSKILEEEYQVVLIGLREEQIKKLPSSVLGLPRTESAYELSVAYTAADVYVCPSVEETFGMTVLEAAKCGTHVIVYRGTACEEVALAYGGDAVDYGCEALAHAIRAYLE